jgi:hypothetical protein
MFILQWKNKPKSLCYKNVKIGEYLNPDWVSTANIKKAAIYFREKDARGELREEGLPVNKYFNIIEVELKIK